MSHPPAGRHDAPNYGGPNYGGPDYGVPSAQQPYGQPQPGGQQGYSYGSPASAVNPQGYHTNIQPYHPAAAPAQYAQPFAPAPYGQPYAGQYPLVSAGGRFGAFLLDGLLAVVTLGIGWLVWSLFTWSDGQSPAKKMLGHVVVDANTGEPFNWGRMALREFGVKGLVGFFLNIFTLGIFFWVDSFMIFGDRQRTVHDRMANSLVRQA